MKFKLFINAKRNSFITACCVAGVLQLGSLAGFAQTNKYLFTGSETNITLSPGIYSITAYGAQGGSSGGNSGGLGAEMEAQFTFASPTTLTLLVGGTRAGGSGGGGGGGGSFVVKGTTPLVVAGGGGGTAGGGGGGSIIDSSAIMILAEISGIPSPDNSPNGEIIITSVAKPAMLSASFANGQFSLTVSGSSNVQSVVQASTNLVDWVSVQTNTAPFIFADPEASQFNSRYYRTVYAP